MPSPHPHGVMLGRSARHDDAQQSGLGGLADTTLLGFVASTLASIVNPDLADNGVNTGVVIVTVFWLGVFMSARGVIYLLQGNASSARMNASRLVPSARCATRAPSSRRSSSSPRLPSAG